MDRKGGKEGEREREGGRMKEGREGGRKKDGQFTSN